MKMLTKRVQNLVYKFSYNPSNHNFLGDNFHLDYENKKYRQSELVKVIRESVIYFALTAQEMHEFAQDGDYSEMLRLAWSRISTAHKNSKGDYGELLLFLLLSIFYPTNRFVTKVRLRSSMGEQIKGFDCAHFTHENEEFTLWLGEAKFHKTFSNAVASAFESLKEHCDYGYIDRELVILGANVEVNNDPDLKELKALLNSGINKDNLKFNIPVLITYDSDSIQTCSSLDEIFNSSLQEELNKHYNVIEGRIFPVTPNFSFQFMLFPLHTVSDIKNELDLIEKANR